MGRAIIVGFLLVVLVLLSGCIPITTPPSASPPVAVPPAPAPSAPEPAIIPAPPEAPPPEAVSPMPAPAPYPEVAPLFEVPSEEATPAPAYMSESTPPEEPEPQPVPVNVTIDYIGIISAHDQEDVWDPDGEIRLFILITDGEETSEVTLPPDGIGFHMGNFEIQEIDQRVFHTSSVGDYLKVSIAAYDIDSKEETLDYLSILEAFGLSGATSLKQLYTMLPQEDDRIGYYESTWYSEESWGIGQYEAVGIEDLRLWFSIWSDTEPTSIPKPSLIPDIKILDADIPSQVKKSSAWFPLVYDHALTIANNEPIDITVDWNVHSSDTGDFGSGSITVPANSSKSITERYFYETAGSIEITYTIFYHGDELDSWSGTVNVVP